MPLVPVMATTGTCGRRAIGRVAEAGALHVLGRGRQHRVERRRGHRAVQHVGHGVTEGLRALPVPPRVRDHRPVQVGRRAAADREPGGAGPVRDPPYDGGGEPQREPLPQPGARQRPAGAAPARGHRRRPGRQRRRASSSVVHVQGQLDGRAGEVEVRALRAPAARPARGAQLRWSRRRLATRPSRARHRRRARSPPWCAGNQSDSSATQARAAGSESLTSQPSGARLSQTSLRLVEPRDRLRRGASAAARPRPG